MTDALIKFVKENDSLTKTETLKQVQVCTDLLLEHGPLMLFESDSIQHWLSTKLLPIATVLMDCHTKVLSRNLCLMLLIESLACPAKRLFIHEELQVEVARTFVSCNESILKNLPRRFHVYSLR